MLKSTASPLPLAVDMDGTLVRGDTLWESCVKLVVHKPWYALLLPFWLFRGKAGFKRAITQHVELDPAALVYHPEVLDYLRTQKQQGRALWLVTAADHSVAERVARYHHELFDGVIASDGELNLSGSNKATALVQRFGEKGFTYAANAPVDLAVWRRAGGAIVVDADKSLLARAGQETHIEQVISPSGKTGKLRYLPRALRMHQWLKNLLLFVPLLLSHSWGRLDEVLVVLLAFFAFCFTASAIYIINDFVDLAADRQHPHKRNRPFAAGKLPLYWGVALIPVLIVSAFGLAYFINGKFAFILLSYITLTLVYSYILKPVALLDVLALTSLYTLRIIAGAVAVNLTLSYWLLAFSMFIFLSLALSKRYSELHNLKQQGEKRRARGYHVEDLPIIILFGISSGYLSVLVTVLYINDLQASNLYSHPAWLWPVSITVLYWISRIWLLAHRGELHEDPVLFAIHDRVSYVVVLLAALSLYLAI